MPAPHFSIWDRLAQGLDPHGLPRRELTARNARHALPRFKKHPLYSAIQSVAITLLVIFSTAVLVFGDKVGITHEQALLIVRLVMGIFFVVLASQAYIAILDQSQPLLRRRRREALIHPRPRRTATRHTDRPSNDALELAELIGRRRDYWSGRISSFRPWDWFGFAGATIWWVTGLPVILLVPQLLMSGGFERVIKFTGNGTVLLAALGVALLMAAVLGRRRLRRLSQSLIHRVCPDCGYSLEDAPDATLPHAGQILGLGPRRCTECGAPWPLLPPPEAIER
jgi:hypothetical protein